MKSNILKLITPAILAISVLASCGSNESSSEKGKYTKYSLPTETTGYYSDFNFSLKSGRMLQQLHQQSFVKHQRWVKYSNVAMYYNWEERDGVVTRMSIDCPDKNNPKKLEYFYTAKITDGKKFSGGNREHVWPCANSSGLWTHNASDGVHYVDGTNYVGGGSDLYHVRPANSAVNTARGNSRFVDFDDFKDKKPTEVEENGGRYKLLCEGLKSDGFANFVEVDDAYKGDVARLIAYVYVHYSTVGGVLKDEWQQYCGGLSLTSILGYDEKQCKEKLCEWNELDPPSPVEINRNDTVQLIQGNRNVFVDYPGLMPRMFGLD